MRYGVDLDAVAAAQPVQRHVLVDLAEAPQDHLVGVLILFQAHGRILGDQSGEPLGELVVVRLAVCLDGQRQQRVRGGPGIQQQRPVRVGEGVPGLGAAQFGDAGQIPRDTGGERALLFAEGEESAPTRTSVSWKGRGSRPGSVSPWPKTWTVSSGRRVPEKTRTSEIRPT